MLVASNKPIYGGFRKNLSKLSMAASMMNIKTDHNLHEVCMDAWDELFKDYLSENNLCVLIMRFRNWFIVLVYLRR